MPKIKEHFRGCAPLYFCAPEGVPKDVRCVFCGAGDLVVSGLRCTFLGCQYCGGSGPNAKNVAGAVSAYLKRPQTDASSAAAAPYNTLAAAILADLPESGSEFFTYAKSLGVVHRGVPKIVVTATLRDLCDLGLVELRKGLMSDDGTTAGSGYARTEAGDRALISGVLESQNRESKSVEGDT